MDNQTLFGYILKAKYAPIAQLVDPPAGGLLSKMFITYAIYNNKNKIYIGFTRDLKKRLERHNNKLPNKKSSFTSKNSGTWNILHIERFLTEKEARKKEKALKSAQGRKFLKGKIYDIK